MTPPISKAPLPWPSGWPNVWEKEWNGVLQHVFRLPRITPVALALGGFGGRLQGPVLRFFRPLGGGALVVHRFILASLFLLVACASWAGHQVGMRLHDTPGTLNDKLAAIAVFTALGYVVDDGMSMFAVKGEYTCRVWRRVAILLVGSFALGASTECLRVALGAHHRVTGPPSLLLTVCSVLGVVLLQLLPVLVVARVCSLRRALRPLFHAHGLGRIWPGRRARVIRRLTEVDPELAAWAIARMHLDVARRVNTTKWPIEVPMPLLVHMCGSPTAAVREAILWLEVIRKPGLGRS